MTKAYPYSAGENGAAMFPYEDRYAFNKETPGLYEGKARYVGERLRMIYPLNVINSQHLQIDIHDGKLKDWIAKSDRHGRLANIGESLWLWEVDHAHLDQVNQILGDAGALVCWKPPAQGNYAKACLSLTSAP